MRDDRRPVDPARSLSGSGIGGLRPAGRGLVGSLAIRDDSSGLWAPVPDRSQVATLGATKDHGPEMQEAR
jgi:hypothetical protein